MSLDYLDILKQQQNTCREQDIFRSYGLEVNGKSADSHRPADFFLPGIQQSDPTEYSQFFRHAHEILRESPEALVYLQSRGISAETVLRSPAGYCPEWRSPAAVRSGKSPPPSRRLIFPTGDTGYTARAIDPDVSARYRFMKEGEAGCFGKEVLRGTVPVFVVEGALDALSIHEVGGAACALGSASGVDKFVELLDCEPPTVPLLLSLDNDKAGLEAQVKLKTALETRKISFCEVNTAGKYKDPNEHLQQDPDAFAALVRNGLAGSVRQEADADKTAYFETAAAFHVGALMGEIAECRRASAVPTGFRNLDHALDGGFYAGLYVLGAISSLGKTTFVLQAADQMAQRGYDVLIFSLEMSRFELMAKSISRLTLENCGGNPGSAKSTRGILDGTRWKTYGSAEIELIERSIADYSKYSRHIFIHEDIGTAGTEQIKREVQRHIAFTGTAPVVIIDYLQIAAARDGATDKQAVDRVVRELKQLSRDKQIPVIAVSSFNRENYIRPVNMASFKESGGVEYSSDVLMGLQLAGIDEQNHSENDRMKIIRAVEEKKKADPRKMQLKILKNRNGKMGMNIFFNYYAAFNAFQETGL